MPGFLGKIGPTELIIILIIVVLLFGVGRISKISGEIGSAIKSFRKGIQDDEPKKESKSEETDEKSKE